MNRIVTTLLSFVFCWVLIGCTVKTPEVTFSSERTAIERQILGSYQTIEEDAWMVSSVRSTTTEEIIIPESKRKVLEAFANRKYNADDVEDFKRTGVVGEAITGYLILRPTKKYTEDQDYKALVDRIIEEENQDRKIIMQRIVEINSTVNPLDEEAVAHVFAQMNRDASHPGTWIQLEDERWVQK